MATATASPRPKHAKPKVADQQMLIGGKWVESSAGKTFETSNPRRARSSAASPRATRPTSTSR